MFPLNRLKEVLCAILIANTIIFCNSLALESNKSDDNLKETYPWINENLLTKAIQQDYLEKVISINSYALTSIPSPSINYLIKLIRVSVDFKVDNIDHETSFIIKTTKKEKQSTSEMNAIEKEIINYQRILPAVNKILTTIDKDEHIILRCYEANLNDYYMVMEDPGQDNFKFYTREMGLTKEHFKVTLRKLARMHAASKFFDSSISTEVHSKKCADIGKDETIQIMEALVLLTNTMPGYEHISKKLKNSTELFYKRVAQAYSEDWPSFQALCQGEICHSRQCTMNILFKNDPNGIPNDALQTEQFGLCWGSVVNDIANGFYMSSDENLRGDDFDEILQDYHSELINTLNELNYTDPLPTLTQLQVQLMERGIGNIAIGLFEYAERYYQGQYRFGLYELIKDPNESIKRRLEIFKSAANVEGFKYMLNYFDRRGYFDV